MMMWMSMRRNRLHRRGVSIWDRGGMLVKLLSRCSWWSYLTRLGSLDVWQEIETEVWIGVFLFPDVKMMTQICSSPIMILQCLSEWTTLTVLWLQPYSTHYRCRDPTVFKVTTYQTRISSPLRSEMCTFGYNGSRKVWAPSWIDERKSQVRPERWIFLYNFTFVSRQLLQFAKHIRRWPSANTFAPHLRQIGIICCISLSPLRPHSKQFLGTRTRCVTSSYTAVSSEIAFSNSHSITDLFCFAFSWMRPQVPYANTLQKEQPNVLRQFKSWSRSKCFIRLLLRAIFFCSLKFRC